MNWNPAETFYASLQRQGVITPEQLGAIYDELELGATPTTALMNSTDNEAVWRTIAQRYNRTFYPNQEAVAVFFTDLMTYDQVLATQMLPQRTSGDQLHVLTHNPTLEQGSHTHPALQEYVVSPRLITPALWRRLYNIGYPKAVIHTKLNEAQATALVTLTEQGTNLSCTPNQHAEILALTRGYQYIDPRVDPPQAGVRDLIATSTKTLYRCYPHHISGNALTVMMVNPEDEQGLRQIRFQTQMDINPVVTTQRNIDLLILQEQGGEKVNSFFDQLGI